MPLKDYNHDCRVFDVTEFLKKIEDPSEDESLAAIQAFTCHVCKNDFVGAAVLPCGHFCLCQTCSKKALPNKCPYYDCGQHVNGACRAYLS